MKISIRLHGRVTSVQVRDSIASLYCLINSDKTLTAQECEYLIQDAVYDIAEGWNGNGRGLGSYITDNLILGILEGEELSEYNTLLNLIQSEGESL